LERIRDARDEVVLADHANRRAHWAASCRPKRLRRAPQS
jgi:hypothetical protein